MFRKAGVLRTILDLPVEYAVSEPSDALGFAPVPYLTPAFTSYRVRLETWFRRSFQSMTAVSHKVL